MGEVHIWCELLCRLGGPGPRPLTQREIWWAASAAHRRVRQFQTEENRVRWPASRPPAIERWLDEQQHLHTLGADKRPRVLRSLLLQSVLQANAPITNP